MNKEIEFENGKKFPWGALAVYIFVMLGIAIYEVFTISSEFPSTGDTGSLATFGVIGVVIGSLFLMISVAIQYAFIKFPTQWISKENNVYKFDIWTALFYSSAVSSMINFIVGQLDYTDNIYVSIFISIISTVLFLFFYISGEEKESHIKRAIIIVQIGWSAIGIGVTIVLHILATNIMI